MVGDNCKQCFRLQWGTPLLEELLVCMLSRFPVPSVIPHQTSFLLKSNETYLTLKAGRNALLDLREHHGGEKGVELSVSARFGV